MVASKLDKKDLEQPDAFQEAMGKLLDYAAQNRRKLYIAAGAIVLAIVLGGGYYFYSASQESEAARLHFDARMKAMRADAMGTAGPEIVKALADVVDRFPSTDAAQNARYELGSLYYQAGDYDRSIQVYREFIDRAGSKDIRTIYAWFGIGYAHEAKKEYEKALEAFSRVPSMNPGAVHEGISYRNIARIHEAMNDRGKALDYYRKALEKTKDPAATTLIKRKIAQLG
ncbi:MAG: tetratricopeptide repeat protein [Syntrophaceae bacterium]|nr:tetratricopeptide repeat protein [Syntrophaceae bacterium]